MYKNYVIVKHVMDNGKYLFRVPKDVLLHAGDKVVCDTARGNDQLVICCCDSFMADPAVVNLLFGTCEKNNRFVTGKVEVAKFEGAEDEEDEQKELGEAKWQQ